MGGFLEVRQANAHIWSEVWLEGKGWVRIDPTAAVMPERVEQGVDVEKQAETGAVSVDAKRVGTEDNPSKLQEVQQLLQNVDYQWQRWVVSYGGYTQSLVLSSLGIGSRIEVLFWVLVSILLIMLVLAGWLLKFRQQAEAPEVKLFRAFCRKMAKAGVVINVGRGLLILRNALNFSGRKWRN